MSKRPPPKVSKQKEWEKVYTGLKFGKDDLMICSLCCKYKSKLESLSKYSSAFINGSSNYRKSNVSDHFTSFVHKKAEEFEREEKAKETGERYEVNMKVPANAAIRNSIDKMGKLTPDQKESLRKLFRIAYLQAFMARPYLDFATIIGLQKMNGVMFFKTNSYENETACRTFVSYCAKTFLNVDVEKIKRSNFVTVMSDGSTDSSVIEKECIYLLYVDPDNFKPTYVLLGLIDVESQDAVGLVNAIKKAFEKVGLGDKMSSLVYFSSDGATVNSGLNAGVIAKLKVEYSYISYIWCFSHRLELGLKDALKDDIEDVDTCLLNLYYMYQKSTKKLRELRLLFDILCELYEFADRRVKPYRGYGTRWIDHKIKAMLGLLNKFGLYLQHIENVIADTSKQTDKATLEGKRRKMVNFKTLILCAFFIDILEPAKIYSLVSQENDSNIVKIVDSLDKVLIR